MVANIMKTENAQKATAAMVLFSFAQLLAISAIAVAVVLSAGCQATVHEEHTDVLVDTQNDEDSDFDSEPADHPADLIESEETTQSNCSLDDVESTYGQFVSLPPTDYYDVWLRFKAPVHEAGCVRYAAQIDAYNELGDLDFTIRVCNRCDEPMAMYFYTLYGNLTEAFEGEQPMEGYFINPQADIGMVARDQSGRRYPLGCPGLFVPSTSGGWIDYSRPHRVNRYTVLPGEEMTVEGHNEMAQDSYLRQGVQISWQFPELPYYLDPIAPDSPLALELQLPKLYPLSVPFEDIHPEQQISIVCELSGFPQVLDTPTSLDDGPWSEDDLFFQTVEDVVLPEILMESLRARPVQP